MQSRPFLVVLALCASVATSGAQAGGACWTVQDAFTTDPSYRFGGSVALSGDTLLVANETFGSGARVHVQSGGAWTLEGELVPSTPIQSGNAAHQVAIVGDLAIVTDARNDERATDAGAAFVFRRSGGTWTEEAKLFASDPQAGAHFGRGLAFDGTRIALGSPYHSPRGVVYVFEEQGGAWVQTQRIGALQPAAFGADLALDGDRLAIASLVFSGYASAADAVHVYGFDGSSWSLEDTLSTPSLEVSFGASVALSGDRLVVGAPSIGVANDDADAVYLFTRTPGGSWEPEVVLAPAPGTGRFMNYGWSVALEGTRLAVGATDRTSVVGEAGQVFVYDGGGGSWALEASLAPPPFAPQLFGNAFGYAVDIEGTTVVAGDPFAVGSDGMAWVFASDPGLAPTVGYRNAGANPVSFLASEARLGETLRFTVAPALSGHAQALVIGFDSPASVTLGGGQVLLCLDLGGGGELVNTGFRPGPFVRFDVPVLHDLALLGSRVCTQAVHAFGAPGFALSNAQDLVLGPPSSACP